MQEPAPRPMTELLCGGPAWLRGEGECADIVVSSRVRLARNLAGEPFAWRATREQRERIMTTLRPWIVGALQHGDRVGARVEWIDLHTRSRLDRAILVERHLISQQHARGKQTTGAGGPAEPRALVVALPEERASVMVNEEDHVRVQVVRPGLALGAALSEADQIDDRIEAGVDFAYSPRFGYLTACPTNVGTGIRLSVMLHLPALQLSGNIDKVKQAASDMCLAVRGFYGEGSEAAGDLYQISNQTTLGKGESVLLQLLEREILPRVVDYERRAREGLMARRRAEVEDRVHRALAILASARLLATEEAMTLLSHARLGVCLGIIDTLDLATVGELMLLAQPAHLQATVGRELDQQARRVERASTMRERLSGRTRGSGGG